MDSDSTTPSWTPTKLWEPLQILTVVLAIVKISISAAAYDWTYPFHGIDNLCSYARIILFSFLICIPFGIFRKKYIQVLTFLCIDIALSYYMFLKANLEVGIIAGLLMLITTVILKFIYNRNQILLSIPPKGKLQYCSYLLIWSVLAYFL